VRAAVHERCALHEHPRGLHGADTPVFRSRADTARPVGQRSRPALNAHGSNEMANSGKSGNQGSGSQRGGSHEQHVKAGEQSHKND